jgi:phosphorylcholine metabolism protein LicD
MSSQLKSININGEQFFYEEIALYHGRKQINREIAKENLELFNSIIEKTNIKYGLIFGTLLGAIRENNFIEHDEDTDLFLLSEYKEDFLKLLKQFKKIGLEVIRYESDLISLMRKDEYIDVYTFQKKRIWLFKEVRFFEKKYQIDAKHLENTKILNFIGINIPVPNESEKFLKKIYGSNWRTPIRNFHAVPNVFNAKIIQYKIKIKELASNLWIYKIYRMIFLK